MVARRRKCRIAAVLVDVGSLPASSRILQVAGRCAADGAIRLGLASWGWGILRSRPRSWGRSAIDWPRAIPGSGRFKTHARTQKLSLRHCEQCATWFHPVAHSTCQSILGADDSLCQGRDQWQRRERRDCGCDGEVAWPLARWAKDGGCWCGATWRQPRRARCGCVCRYIAL
jgi:hypothetical protein